MALSFILRVKAESAELFALIRRALLRSYSLVEFADVFLRKGSNSRSVIRKPRGHFHFLSAERLHKSEFPADDTGIFKGAIYFEEFLDHPPTND